MSRPYPARLEVIGDGVCGRDDASAVARSLDRLARDFGATSPCVEARDAWRPDGAFWLAENHALFDRTERLLCFRFTVGRATAGGSN